MPPVVGFTEIKGWPEGVPLLSFNDPDACAELYDPDLRYDMQHLNEKGAQLFTGRLAQELIKWRKLRPRQK